jgi:hypothetical protein
MGPLKCLSSIRVHPTGFRSQVFHLTLASHIAFMRFTLQFEGNGRADSWLLKGNHVALYFPQDSLGVCVMDH